MICLNGMCFSNDYSVIDSYTCAVSSRPINPDDALSEVILGALPEQAVGFLVTFNFNNIPADPAHLGNNIRVYPGDASADVSCESFGDSYFNFNFTIFL